MPAARSKPGPYRRLSILGLFVLLIAWRDIHDDSVFAYPRPMSQFEAEAIFRRRLPARYKKEAAGLAAHLVKLCREHHFDPAFVLSLIHVESTFNPRARSKVGARGLMQTLPTTAQYIAKRKGIEYKDKTELFDPYKNLTLGVNYLAYLRKRFETPDQFLAAYNLGPSRVRRNLETGDYKMSVIRPYVEKIQKGVAAVRKEGRELALVSSYADALAIEKGLWRGLATNTAFAAAFEAGLRRAPAESSEGAKAVPAVLRKSGPEGSRR